MTVGLSRRCTRGRRRPSDERGLEVGEQVVGRLDPDGEAHQVAGRRERARRCGCVRHPGRVLDQALDTAERFRELEDRRAGDEVDRLRLGLQQERDHAAEVAHLGARDVVARMVRQAGVEHALDGRVPVEELGDLPGVLGVLAHAHRERLDPAQDEPRVEGAGDGAERLLQEVEAFRQRVVVRRDEPADRVAVAAEVLRRRVDDDVGAELERLLQVGRRERVVDDEQRADSVSGVRGLANVDDVQRRVGRRLDPDELDLVVEVGREVVVELGRGHVREAVALRLVDLGGHPVDAAVDIGDQNDALARVHEVHQRGRRAEPRAERDAVLRVLEARERDLERRAGRIGDARVVVALVHADRLLHVRGGLVDGRDDGAGRRVGLLPGMDRARLEVHRVSLPPDRYLVPGQVPGTSCASRKRARLRSGAPSETGRTPFSHHVPSTRSSPLFRSCNGSMRPITRSPRRIGRT